MPRMTFVTLPVRNPPRATAIPAATGIESDPRVSGTRASAMVWPGAIHARQRRPIPTGKGAGA